jgi:cobalamin biosynthesis Mg chelatase CobN
MNSEIISKKINNLEEKVVYLYKNNQLKPSIVREINKLEEIIKKQNIKEPNDPIFNTYLKNLNLFKERTIIKIQKIDLEKKVEIKKILKLKKEEEAQKAKIQISDPSTQVASTQVASTQVASTQVASTQVTSSQVPTTTQTQSQSSNSIKSGSASYKQYLIYLAVFIFICIILYFVSKNL